MGARIEVGCKKRGRILWAGPDLALVVDLCPDGGAVSQDVLGSDTCR